MPHHVGQPSLTLLFDFRFFCYSDPTIAKNTVAPADVKWAAGTIPGVCSSFIWLMMKRNGIHCQGSSDFVKPSDLSAEAIRNGAAIDSATPDGLFLYNAGERSRAAQWFAGFIEDQATSQIHEKAGILTGLVELATKLVEHIKNEFLNAFARDIVSVDDDDEGWARTTNAHAVSPDNIKMWNGPKASTPGPCKSIPFERISCSH